VKVNPPGTVPDLDDDGPDDAGDTSGLASVIQIDRREELAGICGRVDTAPTFAVVIHAPHGNRQLSTELGIRRLQRHADESGKIIAVATSNSALAARARQAGIPVARKPEHVRWDSGGRRVVRLFGRTLRVPRLGRYVQVGLLLAVAVLFVAAALTAAPSAKLTIYPSTETITRTITITALPNASDIDFTNLKVPAQKVNARQTITLAAKTTGTVSVGTVPAKTSLRITNPGKSDVTVEQHAVVAGGPDAVQFELDSAVTVPAGKSANADATAILPGVTGNLAPNTIATWVDDKYKVLAVANPAAAAGGANEDRPGIDAKDLINVKQLATELQKSDSVKHLLVEARPHDAVFLGTAETTIDYKDPPPAGTPADLILLDVDVTVTAYAVPEATLTQVAQRTLTAGQGTGELVPGTVTAVETGARQIDAQTGAISTELQVQGEYARNLNPDELKDAVKGQSTEDAKSTLQREYGIQDADVSVSPSWAPWLPRFNARISVDLRNRAAEDAARAPNDASSATVPGAASPTPGP
jgi:hypothetical protein